MLISQMAEIGIASAHEVLSFVVIFGPNVYYHFIWIINNILYKVYNDFCIKMIQIIQ
jgi:hypothetical protein